MIVSDPPSGILDPKQPYWPANKVGEATWLRLKSRLTGRPIAQMSGERHTSYVKLTEADADKLIANIKKYGKYPQVSQNDKYGGAYNEEQYQEWLVEEFLEKPFRKQLDEKIEEASLNTQIKQLAEKRKQQAKKEAAKNFISSSSTLRPGKKISVKTSKMTGIIPKRPIPQEVAEKISKPLEAEPTEGTVASPSKKVISSLGRLTLDLEVVNNNLDKITEVIQEDYAQTKAKNKKEIEEYRKRIANRERRLPKKNLGDDKKSLKEIIKPFVGGFFSGVGGAIRGLSAFNLLDGLINGDITKVIGALMGIGITFVPQIGMMIAGTIMKSLLKGFGKAAFGRRGGMPMRGPRGRTPRMGGIGKFGAAMALGAGALSLGSAFMGSQQTEGDGQDRLDELEAQEKALAAGGYAAITQDDLKKFQDLNKKFEKILDNMMSKKRSSKNSKASSGSSNSRDGVGGNNPIPTGQAFATDGGQDRFAKEIYDQAVAAGAKHPILAAAIASLETSYGKSEYGNNPFNMRGVAGENMDNKGFLNFNSREEATRRFVQLWDKSHSGYRNLDAFEDPNEAFAAIVNSYAPSSDGNDPAAYQQFVANFIATYGSKLGGGNQSGGFVSKTKSRSVSSTPPPSRGVLVSMTPVPTSSEGLGSANLSGGSEDDFVDPNNPDDIMGRLYRTQWNIVDVG